MAAFALRAGFTQQSFTQRKLALLLASTLILPAIAHAQKPPMVEVGVVLPQDVITGETISGSVIVNPSDYANIPGLHVVKGQVPGIAGSTPANLLSNYSLQIGSSAATPADHPFSFTVTDTLPIHIFRTGGRADQGWSTTVPLSPASGQSFTTPKNFSLPPLNLAGALQRIHGPFSGDGNRTVIRVNNLPARLLIESPRGAYCFLPADLKPGAADWVITDEQRSVRLRSWVLALQMSADKLKLMKGESTAFHVYIKGVETIPQEAWFGSGEVPDFIDPAIIRKFLPDFKPPSPSQPGVLVLTLENMSVGTVTMSSGNKLALTFGYGQGKYEHHGTITATRSGSFDIDGTLIPFLHDQPELVDNTVSGGNNNDNVGNPPVYRPSPTPTPVAVTNEKKKKEEDCPQRGKGCVALVIDFSHNVTWEFDMESLSKKLTAAGCDTDYVAPDLMEIPLPQTYGYEGVASYTTKPDPKDQDAARAHNDPEWKKVRDAIAKHREKVAKGVELAIEIVNGHGGPKAASETLACGNWEWKEYTGDFLYRASFHEGNYRAANKNVCGWFTSDFSCYGGLTPKVVDELENLTTSTCSQASAIACPNHAGWEADSSTSTATNTQTCSNGSIGWQKSYIGDPLDAEIDRRKNLPAGSASSYSGLIDALRTKAGESSTSRYADHGYAKDKPPAHAHGGYDQP
jgi:hypothetical protein